MKLIPHTEYIGGVLADPYLEENTYTIGKGGKERENEKYIAYNKIPFKSYEYHGIDTKKKLPKNNDKLTEEAVVLDFIELQNANAVFEPINSYPMRYVGNHITDYFNEEIRNDTENNMGVSLNDMWNDLEKRKKIYEATFSLRRQNLYLRGDYNHKTAQKDIFKKLTDQDFKGAVQNAIFSNNQFKVFTAKVIYQYFMKKSKISKVLDFSAGWGGRMVGAMSLNLDYTGIDPNVDLRNSYKGILELLKPYNTSKVKMLIEYAEEVDYSKLDYDFVFTSPPYIEKSGRQTERYKNMKDYTKDTFYTEFILPTLYRIIHFLPDDKYVCINTHKTNMEIISRMLLGKPSIEIPYKTKERAGEQKRRDVHKTERYTEMIYCFKKDGKLKKYIEKSLRQYKLNFSLYPKKSKPNAPMLEVKGLGTKEISGLEARREIRKLQKERRQRNINSVEYKGGNLHRTTSSNISNFY